jgi:hypothetical protein
MSIFNITDVTPAGAYLNAVVTAQDAGRRSANRHFEAGVFSRLVTLSPADKALRTMATEEAAHPKHRPHYHVSVPWRGGVACAAILAVVGVVLLS